MLSYAVPSIHPMPVTLGPIMEAVQSRLWQKPFPVQIHVQISNRLFRVCAWRVLTVVNEITAVEVLLAECCLGRAVWGHGMAAARQPRIAFPMSPCGSSPCWALHGEAHPIIMVCDASSPSILGGKLRALTALELQDREARCGAHFLHAWRCRDNGLPVKADPALTMARVHNLSSLQQCLVNTGACSPLPVPFVGGDLLFLCAPLPTEIHNNFHAAIEKPLIIAMSGRAIGAKGLLALSFHRNPVPSWNEICPADGGFL